MTIFIGGDLEEQAYIDAMTPYHDMLLIGLAFVETCRAQGIDPVEQAKKIGKALDENKGAMSTSQLYPEEDKYILGRKLRRKHDA